MDGLNFSCITGAAICFSAAVMERLSPDEY